jgi:hypothetical protein
MVLLFGCALGLPMPPEKIRELLHQMNQPKIAHVLKDEDNEDFPYTIPRPQRKYD